MIKIGIIEDERSVRENLQLFFEQIPEATCVLAVDSVEAALKDQALPTVDILLLDIHLPGQSGLAGIRPLITLQPKLDVIMLTSSEEEEHIFQAICAGATSYLTKRTTLPRIWETIQVVHKGGSFMSPMIARKVINYFKPKKHPVSSDLTSRQVQIVQGLVDGLSYKLIADKLLISVETVRDHIKKIYRKLQVNSKAEVIRLYNDGQL